MHFFEKISTKKVTKIGFISGYTVSKLILRSPNIRLPNFHIHTTVTENGYRTAVFDLEQPVFGFRGLILSYRSPEIGHGVAKIDLREPFSGKK